MHTPASIAKHPIHPMIVPIPIGLWLFSLICDLVHRFGATSPNWEVVAWYTMIGGIVGALIAAVPGLIDLLSLPRNVKRTAIAHMAINLTIVALFILNAFVRRNGVNDGAILLSVIAIALLLVSGWLGGKMVYEQGVAVTGAPGAERVAYQGPERRRSTSRAAYLGPERRMAMH
ncbi:MAG: DUF2231 domain-containing protein [Betaproteobacteria bacterium]|nr:MAG: DUF2231 domain-containing protein [Betaproteobacteria bacterium]